MTNFNRPPSVGSPHYSFWLHVKNGGTIFRDDKLNNVQACIDIDTLGGNVNNIQNYGYSDLRIIENNYRDCIYKRSILNLLAVIHRDGGQYVSDNGLTKAVEDAMTIVSNAIVK